MEMNNGRDFGAVDVAAGVVAMTARDVGNRQAAQPTLDSPLLALIATAQKFNDPGARIILGGGNESWDVVEAGKQVKKIEQPYGLTPNTPKKGTSNNIYTFPKLGCGS